MRVARAFIAALLVSSSGAAIADDGGSSDAQSRERRSRARTSQRGARGGALEPTITGPGDYRFAFRHDQRLREYVVHVPPSWKAGVETPVVLALHGGGGSMDHMRDDRNYGLITSSDQAGYLVVFPNGISPLPSGLLGTWNAGECCGRARDERVNDVGFLSEVVRRVRPTAGGDRARVYAIGMSNGAMMAYRLACEAPHLLGGIMAVAGTDNTTSCAPSAPVPVFHVHARNDDHVLFEGGAGPAAAASRIVTDFTSVPATIQKWTRLNRADPKAKNVLSVPGAKCERHDARAGGAPVQLCVTDTGGHSWPGGSKARASESPSRAIHANTVMWEFFRGL